MKFEILTNDQYVVLKNDNGTLWWPRSQTPTESPLDSLVNTTAAAVQPQFKPPINDNGQFDDSFTCLGQAYGLVGLFQQDKLIVIKQYSSIGRLPFGSHDELYKIHKIAIIPLRKTNEPVTDMADLGLDKCPHDSCTRPVEPPCYVQASFKDSLLGDESSGSTVKLNPAAALISNPQTLMSAGSVQRTWKQIKATASNVKPKVSNRISMITNPMMNSGGGGNGKSELQIRIEERQKLERRLVEEVYKMFNDTHSFYYSWTGDLTNSVQRQQKQKQKSTTATSPDIRVIPLWKRVDDRFFWNKYMLQPVIEWFENAAQDEIQCYSHVWILPIIQGFIQIEKCCFDLNENSPVGTVVPKERDHDNENEDQKVVGDSFLETRDYYWMALISRRSRFRAGTRYKKRGLDEHGRCANYVETEQIFSYGFHTVSFVCVRGSVPLFWSQQGFKYRPPPVMERSLAENQEAFRRHFEEEFQKYENNVVAVNLIEQTGREKILSDSYRLHVIKFDDPRLTYVSFDFHEKCRGMKFENVSILIERIYDLIKEVRYCWIDKDGLICEQRGVFRVNCVDCLDRTNIVMTAIAKAVMDIQLVRLGLLPPEGQLSANSRRIFQLMWARNGDTISRQYAGTAALKSDYTRTGERKITGVVRDGYNSANRYYLNRFKDAYRQAVIDLMQGNPVSEALSSPVNEKSSVIKQNASLPMSASSNSLLTDQEYHERIKMVIEDCKKILVPETEVILGGWPLVDADPVTGTPLSAVRIINDMPECEMDIVLILTKDCYYVADYDDQTDRIVKYQKVMLEDMEKIEIGAEPPSYTSGALSTMRGQSSPAVVSYAVRFHYTIANQTGYFHMFRSTNTRFFNNMAIPIRTKEEALESLKAICESFKVALSVKSLNVPYLEVGRLERRKSKRIYASLFKSDSNDSSLSSSFTRMKNLPNENMVNSSKKLFTGVYSHFSRLRGKLTGTGGNGREQVPNRSGNQVDGLVAKANPTDNATDRDDYESDEEELSSLSSLRRRRSAPVSGSLKQPTSPNNSLATITGGVEQSYSSDVSDGSEFGSEQVLPPINEICMEDGETSPIYSKENMDRVLESCGILVTSPPLRFDASDPMSPIPPQPASDNRDSPRRHEIPLMKSVLHDVDDFVIDSMKKASLRQILRKAESQSQFPLTSSTQQNVDKSKLMPAAETGIQARSPRQSGKCIFNSELALNSIASQPIKADLTKMVVGSHSSDSLDAVTGDGINPVAPHGGQAPSLNYPLMSSSSFAAFSSYQHQDDEFKSLDSESLAKYDSYHQQVECSSMDTRNFLDDSSSFVPGMIKETSLSFSDLAMAAAQPSGGGVLKSSRSSNALQGTPDFMSLNLPTTNSYSNISGDEKDGLTASPAPTSTGGSLGIKKDFAISPLTRITKGIESIILSNPSAVIEPPTTVRINDPSTGPPHSATRTRIIEI